MKKLYKIFTIFSLLLVTYSFGQFHSSMTKVDYNGANSTLKFSTKMSTADLAQALKMDAGNNNFENAAKSYVNNNVSVSVNGARLRLNYTGSQISGDNAWVYYEASGVTNISKLQMRNTILLNDFSSQMNIVNIVYKDNQKTMNFQRGKESNEVSF